jgi:Cys-rich repeat protein
MAGGGCALPDHSSVCVSFVTCNIEHCSHDSDCPAGQVCAIDNTISGCCSPCP